MKKIIVILLVLFVYTKTNSQNKQMDKQLIYKICFEKYVKKFVTKKERISAYSFSITDSLQLMGRTVYQIDMKAVNSTTTKGTFLFDASILKIIHYLFSCSNTIKK